MIAYVHKYTLFICLGLSVLAFLGCSSPKEKLILDGWECESVASDDESARFATEMEYKEDGTSNSSLTFTQSRDAMVMEVLATTSGTWSIVDNQITEEIEEVEVTSVKVNGNDFQDTNLNENFKKGALGKPVVSEIEILNDEQFIKFDNKMKTTCLRKP